MFEYFTFVPYAEIVTIVCATLFVLSLVMAVVIIPAARGVDSNPIDEKYKKSERKGYITFSVLACVFFALAIFSSNSLKSMQNDIYQEKTASGVISSRKLESEIAAVTGYRNVSITNDNKRTLTAIDSDGNAVEGYIERDSKANTFTVFIKNSENGYDILNTGR